MPAIRQAGGSRVVVNVQDEEVADGTPLRRHDPPLRAAMSFWLENADDRGPAEAALAGCAPRIAGYVVAESRPLVHATNPGGRSDGMKQVCCIAKKPGLSDREFYDGWRRRSPSDLTSSSHLTGAQPCPSSPSHQGRCRTSASPLAPPRGRERGQAQCHEPPRGRLGDGRDRDALHVHHRERRRPRHGYDLPSHDAGEIRKGLARRMTASHHRGRDELRKEPGHEQDARQAPGRRRVIERDVEAMPAVDELRGGAQTPGSRTLEAVAIDEDG